MLKISKWFLLIAFFGVGLSSCVYDREMAYFNDEIASLNKKVSSLQEATGSDLSDKISTIQSSQAQARLEIDQLKNEITGLRGRTEDNEHILKRIVEQDLSEQDALKARVEELSARLEMLERMVRQQHAYLGLEPPKPLETQAPPAAQPYSPAPGTGQATGPATPEEAMPSGETELYDHALGLFRNENYEEAMAAFKTFLAQYPKSDRADNAQFWIGESLMGLKKYEQAILAFQKVIKDFPKGNKVPNAMLRQAGAFLEIQDKTSARLLLKKIVKDYPKTSEAELAKKKLEGL